MPPYNPDWGLLPPYTGQQFCDMAKAAGYDVSMHKSITAPDVYYFEHKVNGAVIARAVPPPGEVFATTRYLADKLGIPRDVFKIQ